MDISKIKSIINKYKIYIIIGSIIIIICVIGLIITLVFLNMENDFGQNDDEVIIERNEIAHETKIVIYIVGEVINPGVYELPEESRVIDAINIAGGASQDANLDQINLAYILSDGQKIKIPSINDEINENTLIEMDNEIIGNKTDKVNINLASVSELTKINGIGESTAQKIIDYRNKNGKFRDIEELKNISGIGDSKYNQIKDYIKTK